MFRDSRFQTVFGSPIDARERFGVTILVDALGTSPATERSPDEWSTVLSRRIETLRSVPWTIPPFGLITDARPPDVGEPYSVTTAMPTTFGFSDNLLIFLESEVRPYELLRAAAHYLSRLFVSSLLRGDLLRGAVSVEPFFFVEKDNIAVGPAMVDVAKYYEVADWAGIVLTESAAHEWESSPSGYATKRETQAILWNPYAIPVSEKRRDKVAGHEPRWALAWPATEVANTLAPILSPQDIASALERGFGVPPRRTDVEKKYQNTQTFMERIFLLKSTLPSPPSKERLH